MAYCSFREVLAGLDTRLDTPPSIDSHHPDSGLAQLAEHEARDDADGGLDFGFVAWASNACRQHDEAVVMVNKYD